MSGERDEDQVSEQPEDEAPTLEESGDLNEDDGEVEFKEARAAFTELSACDLQDYDVLGYSARPQKGSPYPAMYRLAMGNGGQEGLVYAFQEALKDILAKYNRDDLDFLQAAAFDGAEDNEVLFRKVEGDPYLGEFITRVLNEINKLRLATMNPNDTANKPRFNVLQGTPKAGGEKIYLFRTAERFLDFHPNKVVFLWKGKKLVRYTEPLISIMPDADCIVYKGFLFIVNETGYKRIFNVTELMKIVAGKPLELIEKMVPMENFDKFKEWVMRIPGRMHTVCKAVDHPRFKHMTFEKFKSVAKDYEYELPMSDTEDKVIFGKPAVGTQVLALLSEAHGRCAFSGEKFKSKRTRSVKKKKN